MLQSLHIKKLAADAGFDLCGITRCHHMADNEQYFRAWLDEGHQSSLTYLERNLDKRFDPRRLVENAQTAVVCAVSYKNPIGAGYPPDFRTKIASYACAEDYHVILKRMLQAMFTTLKQANPQLTGRAFVDTAPLLEKQLAVEAGLGWIGRQSLLVTPRLGSYVVLGELLLTEPVDCYDEPFEGVRCGRCHNCLESCPTDAISDVRTIDTTRCISCHTIEQASANRPDLDGWIFGCDRCQSCCPYNQKAPVHTNRSFDPLFDPLRMNVAQWLAMSETEFALRFGKTPLTRSGLERLKRNVACEEGVKK
ncbi:MAG: tRNA epoxyqueuosine(34) reductase QueG [Alistipes sp.]